MDRETILVNVVFPSLITAILLLLAWRPWNRAAAPARWQFVLSAAALSLPWIITAGNRGDSSIQPSGWIFRPWTRADTSPWFLDFGLGVAAVHILLSIVAPKPVVPQISGAGPRAAGVLFSALQFAITFAFGSLIAWIMLRGMLAQVSHDGDTDDEILRLAIKQASIHVSIIAVPMIAAGWTVVADALAARAKSVLVPATLSVLGLASTVIVFMAGSATLMLLMAALSGIMIAATVMTLVSKPAVLPCGHLMPFFLIWSTILIFTRYNQPQLLPDYFWLLMMAPAGLLAALHPAVWSVRPWLRLSIAAVITLTPPLIVLWQLYPSWVQNMAGATG